MSKKRHIGAANDRRPVNHKNIKKRQKQHESVLEFLKERDKQEVDE